MTGNSLESYAFWQLLLTNWGLHISLLIAAWIKNLTHCDTLLEFQGIINQYLLKQEVNHPFCGSWVQTGSSPSCCVSSLWMSSRLARKIFRHICLKKCCLQGKKRKWSLYSRSPFESSCIYWGNWWLFVHWALLHASHHSDILSKNSLFFHTRCALPQNVSCILPPLFIFTVTSSMYYSYFLPSCLQATHSAHSNQKEPWF